MLRLPPIKYLEENNVAITYKLGAASVFTQ